MPDALVPIPPPPDGIVPARPSASVILVRDGPGGLEAFMVRRHAEMSVNPNVYVFPGGTVHADDTAPGWPAAPDLSARSDERVTPEAGTALSICALRELFEEAGVLLVRDAPDHVLAVDDQLADDLAAARSEVQAGTRSFKSLLGDAWQPAFDLLVPFSHWVTPVAVPARFDTWFFVARLPERQVALHLEVETSDGAWLSPTRLLEPSAREAYTLVYATEQHLHRIAPFADVASLLEFARHKPIRRVQPDLLQDASGRRVPRLEPSVVDVW
jgi:8-oxo-dGTP pyrophosphatase MutT (NUDIX family)